MMLSVRFIIVLMLAVSWLGCENSVDPIVGEDRPYTIWGLFDAGADTQKVRVFPIDELPGISRPGEIDAEVISTNLTTGETRTWTHRRVTYDDSTVGHVFWSPFRAKHEHRYRLEVRRSDGAVTSAAVTVPPEVDMEIEQNDFSATAFAYIYGDVPNLIGVEVRYEATNVPPVYAWPIGRSVHPPVFLPVEISYQDKGEKIAGGWRFRIDMMGDFTRVQNAFRNACLVTSGAPDIALQRVEFRFVSADSSWRPPNGDFDPDILVEPGTMSNVENGYGFFGAGKTMAERWTPSAIVREKIGYRYDRACAMQPADHPSCREPPIPCLDRTDDLWDVYF